MSFPTSKLDKHVQYQQKLGEDLMNWGYFYTHINEEKLLEGTIQNGYLVAGDAQITTLLIPCLAAISLEMADKIQSMAEAGIKIIFLDMIPSRQPGFHNYRDHDRKIQNTIVNLLNTGKNTHFIEKSRKSYKVGHILKEKFGILPQLEFNAPKKSIKYIHKCVDQGHLYFLRHSLPSAYSTNIGFTLPTEHNYIPLWLNLRTGETSRVVQYQKTESIYRIPLAFPKYGEKVILFQLSDAEKTNNGYMINADLPISIYNSQTASICFQPGTYLITDPLNNTLSENVVKFVPKEICLTGWVISTDKRELDGTTTHFNLNMKKLIDWRKHDVLRHCSGPAEYNTTFSLTDKVLNSKYIHILSFGRIFDAATLSLNGKKIGTLLYPPYESDITDHLIAGRNEIRVKVTGTLRNRLVGYGQKRKLVPVGLIGPVKISIGVLLPWKKQNP